MRGTVAASFAIAVMTVGVVAGAEAEEWACSPWEWVHPQPYPLDLSAVVARDGTFWGFGPTGAAVSPDGLTWQRKTLVDGKMTSALWTGSEFLGTAANTVAASSDGITWDTRHEVWQDPIFFTIDLRSIASNGDRYVVVGENYSGRYSMWSPVLLTSGDGVVWSRPAFPADVDPSHSSLSAVIWVKERFVAVGTYLLTSPDGERWSKDETVRGDSLASDGDRVVVVDDDSCYLTRDLTSWETAPSPVTKGRIGWVGGRFWLAGRCAACPDHEPSLWSSLDGRTWQRATLETAVELRSFAASGSLVVGVGGGAAASDGGAWKTANVRASSGLAALAAGPERLVAVGDRGELLVSETGGAWRRVLWGGAARLSDVAWGPAGFVVVGEGLALSSSDGLAWWSRPTPGDVGLSKVVSNGSRYVAVGWGGTMFASSDGIAWSPVDLSQLGVSFNFVPDLAAGGGMFVASVWKRDDGGALIASADGVSWQKVADTASGLPELVWGGGRFLATDFDTVLASADGTSWREVHAGVELGGLQWVGDRFVAWTRSGGSFLESVDGSMWREARGPAEGATTAVGGTLWKAAGDGTIRRSTCGAPAPSLHLPSLAHLPGARETVWRSDVELHNPGTDAIVVGLAATPRGGVTAEAEIAVTLHAGEARRLDDALARWLGLEEAATVEVTSWSGPVMAVARTYNETASGTFGQFIPAHSPAVGIEGGSEGRLIQLGHSADARTGFRTNLGLVAVGSADVPVDLELRRGDGTLLGTVRAGLRGGESVQINDIFRGVSSSDVETAFAVVRPGVPGGRVLTYASVIDNATGDPIFVRPAHIVQAGEAAWLPGSGHLGGLGGSAWRTDLELHNPGSSEVSCSLELFPRDTAGGPVATATVSVPAGASLRLADVVWRQFGHQGGATLRVSPAGGAVMASARTYTEGGDGTFGQYVAAMAEGDAVTEASPRRLIMLRQSAVGGTGFRTNVGLVNITPGTAEVEIEFRAGSGAALGRVMQTLRADESVQLTEVLRLVAEGSVDDAYAVVRTATPGAAVLAYACLVDNRTNDPVFMPSERE